MLAQPPERLRLARPVVHQQDARLRQHPVAGQALQRGPHQCCLVARGDDHHRAIRLRAAQLEPGLVEHRSAPDRQPVTGHVHTGLGRHGVRLLHGHTQNCGWVAKVMLQPVGRVCAGGS